MSVNKMTTPIVDFVKKYADSKALRLHMPGHKGECFLGAENLDITEIEGADVLYNSKGIIRESEQNAAAIFKTKKTIYSAEGSSLSIRAMLYLVKIYAKTVGVKPIIAAGRNAHKTFVTACGLLGLDPAWLLPENVTDVISCEITADFLERYLSSCSEKPVAVYVTSPDYLGNTADIKALSEVCKKHKVLLLVDNAHGAYLRFLEVSQHPIDSGADICCDSAHKTLPVLTGGAYLHISNTAPDFFSQNAEKAMSLFASTSPSYLILQSLDSANKYLAENYGEKIKNTVSAVGELKRELFENGYELVGNEPLKLTIKTKAYGYTGYEMAEILAKQNIICEFSDPDYIVMMFTPQILNSQIESIKCELLKIERKNPIKTAPPHPILRKKEISVCVAINLPSVEISIDECEGKIAAAPTVNCPPAVPIVICGELIDHKAIKDFKYYGIEKCLVINEKFM